MRSPEQLKGSIRNFAKANKLRPHAVDISFKAVADNLVEVAQYLNSGDV